MAKKKRRQPPSIPPESPASLFITIGWTLSVLMTLGCSLAAALIWLVVKDRPSDDTSLLFVRLLHFSAIVTGFVSLVLLPIVLKVRREPPPRSFVVFAILVAALPMLAALL